MQKTTFLFFILLIILTLLTIADIAAGSVNIPFSDILNYFSGKQINEKYRVILNEFRIPGTLTAIIAGASLSVAGLQMQTFFGNPLAGPYVLGISSGASLGVALLLMSPLPLMISGFIDTAWLTGIVAGTGAAAVLLLIFLISLRVKDIMTVLIIGILTGSAVSAVVGLLQYFGNETDLKTFVVWTMGSLRGVGGVQLKALFMFSALGLFAAILSYRILNILLLGESYAITSGLNLKLSAIIVFAETGILAGSVTAFCGPIGFIGIIVPHLSRSVFKTVNHKILIPASAIIGAILMLISDIISQLPGSNITLPINSVTAILGIPVVIYIILKNRI